MYIRERFIVTTRTVKTKEQLKEAQMDKVEEIIVVGKLAKDLKKAKKITTLSATSLAALTAVIGAGAAVAPFTGGASLVASFTGAAASTGLSIPIIMAIATLGSWLVLMMFKYYEEVEFDLKNQTLKLRRK